jgi:hypothetical protein
MPPHEYVCIQSRDGDASARAFAAFRAAFVVKPNDGKGLEAASVSWLQNPSMVRGSIMFAVQHGIGRTSLQDAAHDARMGLCVAFSQQDPSG